MSEALRKAISILDALRDAPDDLSARDLAVRLDIPKSTAQRLLQTLEESRMAMQDPVSRKYRLGPHTLALGMAYRERLDLRNAALPHMRALRDATDETIGLSVAMGAQRMFIEEVQSQSELRTHSELGHPYPLWAGAPGRVLLAHLLPAEIDAALNKAGDAPWQAIRLRGRDEFAARLAEIRSTGHDRAFDETISGVSAIAVPVHDASARAVAALSVSGPSARMSDAEMDRILPETLAAAERISHGLGG
ncbi:IclR family transcriptional regulator [Amycolatopsis acidiphila]|uniref:IclR family transcriptional regulator n=1 Tax=Amycolatopsis acidiphila TaxID=715473 RepID=A0A558AL66_9PSEU|nr:IclR family transcriptional regulator [Amycolatopsis acidiphila]TVT25006.1 IclR family transcriptional regulator [Amycolatopsis acidiphila]UIJ57486.1 IclR family transcriptional regulator [Amycolatopsis acidiphila]GHG96361.1 IclR family transcriptional regulator [Amycolatopsis acidiphila]